MQEKLTKNKGITLIALVITIIILLILAGISISSLTGSGLFGKAQDAVKLSKLKEIEEAANLAYMERQIDSITGGENATIALAISDLKEKGYTIKEVTSGANSIIGIALSEENITMERSTEKTVTYTLIYSEGTVVRYFVEVQGKDYEILFNNGNITVNVEETNIGEISKEPEVIVESSDNNIIEANKTEEGKIVLTAKKEIGDVTITVKETNSNVTKTFIATTRIPAINITIVPKDETIKFGKTLQLQAIVEPSNTTDIIEWSSSNNIVTITQKGLAKGEKGGTAMLTVTCGNVSDTCSVTVEVFTGVNSTDTNPGEAMPSGVKEIVEADASKGMVIKDKNNVEWVWIEVPKTIVFKTATSSTDYTKIKNDLIEYAKVYRSTSNDSDVWHDECGVADAATYNTMYNKMLKSVYENGGFWIQRYEYDDNQTEAQYYFKSLAMAQAIANNMCDDDTKTSSLLFGIQWDLVCKYLEGKEGLTQDSILNNSTSWGLYYGNNLKPRTDQTKRMNIYDFAGNFWEYTLEYSPGRNSRNGLRGGSLAYNQYSRSAAARYAYTTNNYISFRATIY